MAMTGTMMEAMTLMRFEPPKMTNAVMTMSTMPSATASPMSCVTRITLQGCLRRSAVRISCMRARKSASRAEKGSSMKRT